MTKRAKQTVKTRRDDAGVFRIAGRASTSALALTIALSYGVPAARAQVVKDGFTDTTISTSGSVTDITTNTIRGSTAFNSFSSFSVASGETVNLIQPDSTAALVNVVRGGRTDIAGQLNTLKGGVTGGNVYIVNPDGFVVAAGGVINAGTLTLSTGSADFADDLIDEANGGSFLGDTPTALLFAGREDLSATGDITVDGDIFARRLTLRAGARMLIDGRITVSDPGAVGTLLPAVNTEGMPIAGAAEVEGGVIRLFAAGEMSVDGTLTAKRGTRAGGLIEGAAEGNLTLGSTAVLDVRGGADDAGAVVLFTKGSALLENGVQIKARSVGEDGGFFALTAQGAATIAGDIDTGADLYARGEVVVRAKSVTVTDTLVTRGGGLALIGEDSVTVGTGVRVSTRSVSATDDPFTGAATDASGDMFLIAPQISVTGATLTADAAGANKGGMVALIARDRSDGIAWAIGTPDAAADITIANSTITGGSVVVSAFGLAANTLGSDDPLVEETQVDAADTQAETLEGSLESALDQAEEMFDSVLERGLTTVNGLVPIQVQVMKARATVSVTNSTLTGRGNWKYAGITPVTPDPTDKGADNGLLSMVGLRQDEYEFLGDGVYGLSLMLPADFDPAKDAVVIHAHGQTDVAIAPKSFGLGVAVAVTDTTSRVTITDSTLRAIAGDVSLASTLTENHKIAIGSSGIAGVATGVVVTTRTAANQLLVKGGSITAAGDISAQALTGKAHVISNVSNAGKEGKLALAVTVAVGNTLTEAALGGTISAGGSVDLNAETLYFAKSHTAGATMGVASPVTTFIKKQPLAQKAQSFANSIKAKITGKDPNAPEDPAKKPALGLGFTVDVQLDDDDTYATLGGDYHDLDASRALTALGTTDVTATDVDVNSTLRFASVLEGGSGLKRSVSASMGKFSFFIKKQAELLGLSEEEVAASYGNAVFLSASVSSMLGDTQAEIGADATVTANTLDVAALTRYPNHDPLADIKTAWTNFTDAVSDYNPFNALNDNPDDDEVPPAPDLIAVLNPLNYLTTDTAAKAKAPDPAQDPKDPAAEDQKLAVGITVNVFNTENRATAVIRGGAKVDLTGDMSVKAQQDALFLHAANLPMSNPFGAKVNNAVGGAINVVRAKSTVEALIENGADITSDALDVEALTRVIQANLAYSGGSAKEIAINAAVGANIMEAVTTARVGDDVALTAGAITITARDTSVNWGISGAIAGSENIGVGASGVVNFATRQIYAGIGAAPGQALSGTAGADRITADSLTITAENGALDVAVAVAGSKVSGSTQVPEAPPPEDQTNEEDMIIPSWLFSEDENTAISAQSSVDTPADSTGAQQKTGWSVSGAASLNLMLGNTTTAELATNGKVTLTGDASVTATNSNVGVTVGGAVAAGLGKTQDTNALAGAFSVHVDARNVEARMRGVTLEAAGVTVGAKDEATVVNVAVGGAGSSKGKVTVAGSVAVAVLTGGTLTDVEDATIDAGTVTLSAKDSSTTVGVGGAVSINLDMTQGYGVGIGIAANAVDRDALTRVRGATSITTGAFAATSEARAAIYGFGISAGVGKTGVAGSVSVNVITGGAKTLIEGSADAQITINATSVNVQATEDNQIYSLAGAITGGQQGAIGGAIGTNVIVAGTEAVLSHVDVARKSETDGDELGAVTVSANTESTIYTLSVAGGAATQGTGVGVGLSVNEITAATKVRIEDSTITDAASLAATATGGREIYSLGGGVVGAGNGAAGFAATLNLLLANDTVASLDRSTISTRTGAISASATASGTIKSIAAAISASKDTAIGGAATVNVSTGTTEVTADDATLDAATTVTLAADDTALIQSLAGAAAGGVQTAVGAAVAANFIYHDTAVLADQAALTARDGAISATADNTSTIDSIAVGLGASGNLAISGSIAIGMIGNTTRVAITDTSLDAGTQAVTLAATRTPTINILAGAAAGSGSNAFGVAVTVAVITGGVTSDLSVGSALVTGGLSVTADSTAEINAIAAAGAGGGSNAGAGSIVYTQIGRPAADGPSVAPLPGGEAEDPLGAGQDTGEEARDGAVAAANSAVGRSDLALALTSDDITRARVELTDAAQDLPALTVAATESSTIRSLAGAVAGGGTSGFGAGITVNLMFGKTEAELILPAGDTSGPTVDRTDAATVAVLATQAGVVQTMAAAGGVAGTVGGAGSIGINVMNRQTSARIAGNGPGAGIETENGDGVTVRATQTGTIQSLAGAVGIGGTAGVGGAIVVNVMSDDVLATVEDAEIDLSRSGAAQPLTGAGNLEISATQTLTLDALSAAVGAAGTGAFAGSFAVNVADGSAIATLRRATARVTDLTVAAKATTGITGMAGAVAAGAGGAVGIGIVTNVSHLTVRSDLDDAIVRGAGAVRLTADAVTTLAGNAVSGGVSDVGVTGSGVSNVAGNVVEVLVRDTDQRSDELLGSDIVTRGSVLMRANGQANISLLGGADQLPGANLSFAGGTIAGVGVALTVNKTEGRMLAAIEGASRVVGLGETTVDAGRLGLVRGVAIDARGQTDVAMLTANGSVAGVVAVSGLFAFNMIDDSAVIRIGDGTIDGSGAVNTILNTEVAGDLGTVTPNAGQDSVLSADIVNTLENYGVALAIAGKVGAGAAAGTALVTSRSEVLIDVAEVSARDDVAITATADTEIDSFIAGIGGGFVGLAASANVNRIASEALITLRGGYVTAGEPEVTTGSDVTLTTRVDNDATAFVGGVAGGAVGAAGAIQVNLFESTSKISVESVTPEGETEASDSEISATGNVTAKAETVLGSDTYAASGAGGAFGLALSANVTLARAETAVDLGAGQRISAGGDLELSAKETITITGTAGGLGAGAVGVGASIDYARLESDTRVTLGDGAVAQAKGKASLTAESQRTLASRVAVGSAGGAAFAAAISVVEMGARASDSDGNRDALLANVQSELDSSQETGGEGGSKSSAESIAAYSGGASTRDDVIAARQDINVTGATGADSVKVTLGRGAQVLAGTDATLSARGLIAASQFGGALTLTGFGGVSSGIVVGDIGTGARIALDDEARIQGDGAIRLTAETLGTGGANVLTANAATVGASAGYQAGVGVAVARLSGAATVAIGDKVAITGSSAARADSLTVTAQRADAVRAHVFNLTAGLIGGAGLVVADASNVGSTSIVLGRGTPGGALLLAADAIGLKANDLSRAEADAVGSTGGILVGLNGVVANARNAGSGTLTLLGTTIDGGAVTLQNLSSGRATARATGISVGAVAIGASIARARAEMALATTIDGGILADSVAITTRIDASLGKNAQSWANSSGGGLLAGNGAESEAFADYTASTLLSGDFVVASNFSAVTSAASVAADAEATGKQGGVAAIGVTIARAGQSTGKTSSVTTTFAKGSIIAGAGGSIVIDADNAPSARADAISGSGGLVSGSGAEARITTRTRTLTDIGTTGAVVLRAPSLTIGAGQSATLGGSVDTLSAAAVGVSGADIRTSATSDVDTILRGTVDILAGNIDIRASNSMTRPNEGFNVTSGSGGALDVAAMVSRVDVWATTDLDLRSGAKIVQSGDPENPGTFRMGVMTAMTLIDRIKLDSGGVIAIPIGDSRVVVNQNDAIVSVGDVLVSGVGTVRIYAGGNADILAEADTKSYGAAGAASSLTKATYNANHRINLADGSVVESLGDIALLAGHTATGLQSVSVRAESRVFNKTAFPIVTNPDADALANTHSIVSVGQGARVVAVQDVIISAEGGARNIVGYGRGKDLYREVLAAIGSFFSNLVGGGDVSLDIETGTSTDTADNGILVNGYVRAGSRNQQIMVLRDAVEGETGRFVLDNGILNKSNDLADGITYSVRTNVSVADELSKRIDLLNSYINDPVLKKDAGAVAAWTAERDQLVLRLAGTAGARTDIIVLDDIRAVEGDIVLRTDYVHGGATGTLEAPGNALIQIYTYSQAFLQTGKLTIPTDEGGRIFLNDVVVANTGDVAALNTRSGTTSFAMISGENSDEPRIEVVTSLPQGSVGGGGGTIIVARDVSNFRGTVQMVSNYGDMDVRADISAATIKLDVPNGDFILGYTPGITSVGGEPGAQYASLFSQAENRFRVWLTDYGWSVSGIGGQTAYVLGFLPVGTVPAFEMRPTESRIRAGKNVYISADVLNINGLIQAGRGSYTVNIGAGVDAELDALRLTKGSGVALIYDPAEPVTNAVIRSPNITSDVRVYYNATTDQIEVEPMIVQGGRVELVGQIISTGSGRVQSLDGFGQVNLTSASNRTIVLDRIDAGASEMLNGVPQGVEGVVRITDTSKYIGSGASRRPLITEYRRIGSTLKVMDNTTFTETIDANGIKRVELTNVVSTSTANDGRSAIYAPTENRDLVVLRSERTVTTRYWLEKILVVIGISGTKEKKYTEQRAAPEVIVTPGASGPYITTSLVNGGQDYAYAFAGQRTSISDVSTPKVKTHDSVRWWKLGSGWIHYEWTQTITTTQLYEHRLKADYPIQIAFAGADNGALNINAKGSVIFGGGVSNVAGQTTAVSQNGSLLTAGKQITFETANTALSALGGRIGSLDGEFRMDQVAGATITATARDAIDLREMRGDMIVVSATTTNNTGGQGAAETGNIRLTAKGNVVGASATSLVSGRNIDLRSTDAGIGSAAQTLRVDLQGGRLSARARTDVDISEIAGDLGVNLVRSDLGSVTLRVPFGSILDRNNLETRDIRTQDELVELWAEDLGLYGAGLDARAEQQVAAIEAERTRSYQDYWARRSAAGGGAISYALPDDIRDALTSSGYSQDMIDAYAAERAALYAEWNAQAAYDPAYAYALSSAAREALLASIKSDAEWTPEVLTRSIRAGLVRQTGDTQIRVEDPNVVAAGDITLIARDAVGELLTPYVIGTKDRFSDADLVMIAGAERDDIEIDTDTREIRIRQREDLNFAFTSVTGGKANGSLRVQTGTREIFLGAQTPAGVALLDAGTDVQLKVDGALTDDRDGDYAVRGTLILLESGNNASIGEADNPLTVDVRDGGALIARSGKDVFIRAPFSDIPVSAVFAAGHASILADQGAITDAVQSDLPRIVAGRITLNGATIGTEYAALGIELTDATKGEVSLTTTVGDVNLWSKSDLPLAYARIAGGGQIEAKAGMSLIGTDTVVFGTGATLRFVLPTGLDLTAALGTDFAGGALEFETGGGIGTDAGPLTTRIAKLSLTGTGDAATPLVLSEEDDLRIEEITQTDDKDSRVVVTAGGDVSIGTITSKSLIDIEAAAILDGRLVGERVVLATTGGIGGTERVDVTTARFKATTEDGSADILLRDRAVEIEAIAIGGDGTLDLESTEAPVTLLAKVGSDPAGITTQGGALTADLTSLEARADILSQGGAIALSTVGDLVQVKDTRIDAGTGTLTVDVGGDMTLSHLVTRNATRSALSLTVDGALGLASGATGLGIDANAAGALSTIRLGSLTPVGPKGLATAIDTLDMVVETGDLHLREQDALVIELADTTDGTLDIFAGGDVTVDTLASRGMGETRDVVLGALGAIRSDAATLIGSHVRLFAFDGDLVGETTDTAFRGNTETGARLDLLAKGDLAYTETAGDLRVGFALADEGDLTLAAPDGGLTAGVLGAGGYVTVATFGDLLLNAVGGTEVDLADEETLKLVEPDYYGRHSAASPRTADFTATGEGARIRIGLASVRETLGLHADLIDVFGRDASPADGLHLVIDDAKGDFAETVDVNILGDGPTLFLADPFEDIRPRLSRTATSTGTLMIDRARIGTGQVTHMGPRVVGSDIVINGDVWFRQRAFDLFAMVNYRELSTADDAQIYALNGGRMGFTITGELVLTTDNVLVLNRKLGGLDLNGGQGFNFGVGVETGILGNSFVRSVAPAGVTNVLTSTPPAEDGIEVDGPRVRLPMILASAE